VNRDNRPLAAVLTFAGMALVYFCLYPEDLAVTQQAPAALYGVAAVSVVAWATVRIWGRDRSAR
jgi:hypothetical protein